MSIISPVFKAAEIVEELVSAIKENIIPITESFEIILVDDGSPDNSWDLIQKECKKDSRVKGIKLSRNFGQHYAISAGLDKSKGEWVVVMDCDLQDIPSEIPRLLSRANEGFDIVLAQRQERSDAYTKKLYSRIFYKFLECLTGVKQDSSVANFGIYHRKVIDAVCFMREQIRYFPTMIKWVGFRKDYLVVKHGARSKGKSSYNFRRLFSLAIDILLSSSEKPIKLIVLAGFLISVSAFLVSLIVLIKYLNGSVIVAGYTSLMLSVWLLGGLIIFLIGILGLYIGKIFQNVKNRPIYIVSENLNFNEN